MYKFIRGDITDINFWCSLESDKTKRSIMRKRMEKFAKEKKCQNVKVVEQKQTENIAHPAVKE